MSEAASARIRVAAITLDFGNTLVRVDRPGFRDVDDRTAAVLARQGIVADRAGFLVAWAEERARQFREEVPEFREVDVDQRAVRVLARLRGMTPPPARRRWDDAAAAARVEPAEVEAVVEAFSAAFVDRMTPVDDATTTLQRLSERGFSLAILSNWPLARTIDRFAVAHDWTRYLHAIVVSQRVGTIKPHPRIFEAAAAALGLVGRGREILHVGDDWAADVIGANGAGWRTAYLRDRQADTPLPTSRPGDAGDKAEAGAGIVADLVIDELSDLDRRVELLPPPTRAT